MLECGCDFSHGCEKQKNDRVMPIKGGFRPITLEKNDFELGVRGEGQDTSQHFEGSFESIRAILPI